MDVMLPGLEDEWKVGCPKSPMMERESEAWSEDESVSSGGSREGNVCNDALHVIGLLGPGGKISPFLKDWEQAKVALSCHMALDMLCQEMHMLPRGVLSRHECFSLTMDGLLQKGEGSGERK